MPKKFLIAFFVGITVGTVSFAFAEWTPPTATPPNDNTPAPLNVGILPQNKDGVLTLGGLGVLGSALITSGGGYTLPSTLQLGVNGYVGAKGYCDENGNNCVTTLGGAANNGTVSSGGKTIVCGGWDVKYGTTNPINTWGCAGTDSSPSCPSGYDTIKSSKVTINLAEQTNLCVLHSAGGGSGGSSQILPGWPNKIRCADATSEAYLSIFYKGYPSAGKVTYLSAAPTGSQIMATYNYNDGSFDSIGQQGTLGPAMSAAMESCKKNISQIPGI